MVKNPPDNAGDLRDTDLIPGLGRSPGEGNGNPLQYSCLENSIDRGAWWAAVPGVAKSGARLSSPKHTQARNGLKWSAGRPGKSHRSLKRSHHHHRMLQRQERDFPGTSGAQWLRICPSPAGGTGLILAQDPTCHAVRPKETPQKTGVRRTA